MQLVTFYNPSTIFPSGQSIFFDWITIVYLAILVISLLIGIKKGMISMLVSLVGLAIAVGVAILLAKPCANWLQTTSIGTNMSQSIYDWLAAKSPYFGEVMTKTQATSYMPGIVNSIGVPGVFQDWVSSFALNSIPEVGASLAVGVYISRAVCNLGLIAISFLVLFIVFLIIMAVVAHLTKNINKTKFIGPLNRIFGGVFGLLIGCVFIAVLSYGLTMGVGIEGFGNYISTALCLGDDTKWSFAKMIYEQNFLAMILQLL